MNIDFPAIVERGYLFNEEYDFLFGLGDFIRVCDQSGGINENFWAIEIENEPNLFIFANNPIAYWNAPRSVIAMIGHMDKVNDRNIMDPEKTSTLLEKAGQAAVDYYNSFVKKEDSIDERGNLK